MGVTGATIFQQFLECFSISHVFGNPGTTETTLLEAIAGRPATEYVLALQESSAVGIAAGFACATGRPAVVNIHTYPGLANSLCNSYNALCSGVPLLLISGQQDRRHLLHNPVLSGDLTRLASTAVKYALEVARIEDLAVALQRCYVQASLPPTGPTFLSIPMDLMADVAESCHFKATRLQTAAVPDVAELKECLEAAERLVIIADYAAGEASAELGALATHYGADIYSAPFHVQGVVDPAHPRYRGQLPARSGDIRAILAHYDTALLLGEKLDVFLYTGANAIPPEVRLVQVTPSSAHLSFDFPCDLAILGDVRATLQRVISQLPPADSVPSVLRDPTLTSPIEQVLSPLPRATRIVTEGGSQDAHVQASAIALGFQRVHFSPRGGGLGWAMPLAVGLSLAEGQHSVCFVGDGGSLYAMHAVWTAARHQVPVIFVCFVNREYRILKDLWTLMNGKPPQRYVGLDFSDPPVDVGMLAAGFGARVAHAGSPSEAGVMVKEALSHVGPTFLTLPT